MNILDLLPLLPEVIQLLLQKFEFFFALILPFLYGILEIFFVFGLLVVLLNVLRTSFTKDIFC